MEIYAVIGISYHLLQIQQHFWQVFTYISKSGWFDETYDKSRRDKPSSNPDTELDLISAVRKDLVVLGSSRGLKSSLNISNSLIASSCAFW